MYKLFTLLICVAVVLGMSCDKTNDPGPDDSIDLTRNEAKNWVDSILSLPSNVRWLIEDVSIIDTETGAQSDHQYVLIENGKIVQISTSMNIEIPDAQKINGSGKFLIPGLSDMHVHLIPDDHLIRNLFLYIAHGVTTIRVMWGFRSFVSLRDSINSNLVLGPRMYVASAGFNGPSDAWGSSVITNSPGEVKDYVKSYKDADFDFIKVYSGIPSDQYAALLEASFEHSLPVIGHIPFGVGLQEVANKSQSSIEHLGEISNSLNENTFSLLKQNKVWVCPTLTVINRSATQIPTYQSEPLYSMITPVMRAWYDDPIARPVSGDLSSLLDKYKNTLFTINNANVDILSGTDTGIRYIYPGKGLHEELQHYINSGLTPLEALQTSTINVGKYLGGQMGQIVHGAPADLVLLDANPLLDINHTREIAGVMNNGRWITIEAIERTLSAFRILHN